MGDDKPQIFTRGFLPGLVLGVVIGGAGAAFYFLSGETGSLGEIHLGSHTPPAEASHSTPRERGEAVSDITSEETPLEIDNGDLEQGDLEQGDTEPPQNQAPPPGDG